MGPAELIAALSDPSAYPYPVERVEVRHTHISAVFLAGGYAYKVKKPVDLGFLDFRTLERRQHFCAEEVRLNRRLAPQVYEGVVPVVRTAAGVKVEGAGAVLDWAVKMVRLPDEATLLSRLRAGQLDAGALGSLARRLAEFHASSEGGPHVAAFGRFEVVAGNARENLEQTRPQVGDTVHPAVFARLSALLEQRLAELRLLIEARAARGVPRDTHGDLHLDHVYLFPGRPPPDDLAVIDCIEFNERFRYADPVADMAFLVMDLLFRGRPDLAGAFREAYFTAAGDAEGRALLPFYVAYRAAVRGKVEGLELAEREVPEEERRRAGERACGHWLLALGALEEPGCRPALVLVAGLPGTGKSTLARALGARAGLQVIRSDVVRKELAGPLPREDLYTPEWGDRTYAECLRRADELLRAGSRVVVDANFREERRRRAFLELATARGVPALLLVCRARAEVVQRRLAGRHGDASDADWEVHQEVARAWEEPGPDTRRAVRELSAEGPAEATLGQALAALAQAGLYEGGALPAGAPGR
jgi:aminoglycoside phosphotransferase family enzyme/predicted kinase